MAKFSVTEAATAGFGIISRKPLAVVGWALALIVGMVLPALLCVLALGPEFVEMMKLAAEQKGQGADPAALQRIMALNSGLTGLNMLYWLWATFVKSVFCAAVFRAVLTPERSAWAYLRVSSREMWLALVLLVEQVLLGIAAFVLALVIGVIVAMAAVGGGEKNALAAAIITGSVGGAVAVVVVVWIALRLSMAGPMSFVDNQFRLFESWDLTRGQGWALLGVALLTVVFVLVVEMVIGGVVVGLIAAGGGTLAAMHGQAGLEAVFNQPPAQLLRQIWPWLTLLGLFGAVFGAVVQAVFYAPWAFIYRSLTRAG